MHHLEYQNFLMVSKIQIKNYLVNQSEKQFFVIVTDEFIESRQLAEKITYKKFLIGNFSFTDYGIISYAE